jgi:hypothetical protein
MLLKILKNYSPETIIPNSGGINARELANITRRFIEDGK